MSIGDQTYLFYRSRNLNYLMFCFWLVDISNINQCELWKDRYTLIRLYNFH